MIVADAGMKRAEPLVDLHVWLPKSLKQWIEGEARRRELPLSVFVRSHFAAVKERQETKPQ